VEAIRAIQLKLSLAAARLRSETEGQAMVEYALLVSLIAIVSVGVLTVLGHNVSTIFQNVANQI
jgi:pilus assembly protein Flp/PilA